MKAKGIVIDKTALINKVKARLKRARSLDQKRISEMEREILEKERAVNSYISEWRSLGGSRQQDTERVPIRSKRSSLLREIARMRYSINNDISVFYSTQLLRGLIPGISTGKNRYPDLNNSSCLTSILQRSGIPVTDADMMEDCSGLIDVLLDDGHGIVSVLDCFREFGITGKWFRMVSKGPGNGTSIEMAGMDSMERSAETALFVLELIKRRNASCRYSLPRGGSPEVAMMPVDMKGLVQLIPDDETVSHQRVIKIRDLARIWADEGYAVNLDIEIDRTSRRRFALDLLMDELQSGMSVMIEAGKKEKKKEYIIDELNPYSRKIALIDPMRPRGSEKLSYHYGKEFDEMITGWSLSQYRTVSIGTGNTGKNDPSGIISLQ